MDYREGEIKMINRVNRTLLNDIEKIYFSIQCTSFYCEDCRNKQICDIIEDLMKSLKKFYRPVCNMNHYSSKGRSYIEIPNNTRCKNEN